MILTVSDVLPRPLVILEERMPLNLIEAITAKSNFPANVSDNMFLFEIISETVIFIIKRACKQFVSIGCIPPKVLEACREKHKSSDKSYF